MTRVSQDNRMINKGWYRWIKDVILVGYTLAMLKITYKEHCMNQEIKEKLFYSEREAQEIYGFSLSWWRRKRWKRNGPKFFKIGDSRVGYKLSDLKEFFSKHTYPRETSN